MRAAPASRPIAGAAAARALDRPGRGARIIVTIVTN
jgi:hypothetical protein